LRLEGRSPRVDQFGGRSQAQGNRQPPAQHPLHLAGQAWRRQPHRHRAKNYPEQASQAEEKERFEV
ncbi:uncharacterized protein METZ01_LOCUS211902, partial [marine metagenome]